VPRGGWQLNGRTYRSVHLGAESCANQFVEPDQIGLRKSGKSIADVGKGLPVDTASRNFSREQFRWINFKRRRQPFDDCEPSTA
jgi:hypothetical protein